MTDPTQSLKKGDVAPDKTIYAGISPDSGKPFFAAPHDADLRTTFNKVSKYVDQLNQDKVLGHNDWRLPTAHELEVLYRAKNKGQFKGTFEENGQEGEPVYMSSTTRKVEMSLGNQFWVEKEVRVKDFTDYETAWYDHYYQHGHPWDDTSTIFSVRCVRDGELPEDRSHNNQQQTDFDVAEPKRLLMQEVERRRKLKVKPA